MQVCPFFEKVRQVSYLEWTNELDLGIGEIDEQHHHLAGFINVLAISVNAGAKHEQLVRILDDLIADALVHFLFEAEMFERTGYAHAHEHKRSHSELLRKLNGYRSRFRAGEDVLDAVLDTLWTWLPNHVKYDDAEYAASLREAPVSVWIFRKEPRGDEKGAFAAGGGGDVTAYSKLC
jgi:hemerythrin